jgi:hypothetical protein
VADLDREPLDAMTRLLASDLSGATLEELAELLRQAERSEVVALGRAVVAMRQTSASWRQLERATGKAQSTLRFWHDRYLEAIGELPAE